MWVDCASYSCSTHLRGTWQHLEMASRWADLMMGSIFVGRRQWDASIRRPMAHWFKLASARTAVRGRRPERLVPVNQACTGAWKNQPSRELGWTAQGIKPPASMLRMLHWLHVAASKLQRNCCSLTPCVFWGFDSACSRVNATMAAAAD